MEYITSIRNDIVKHFSKLVSNKKYRNECNLLVFEGEKMLNEAILSGVEIDIVLILEKFRYIKGDFRKILVTENIISLISETKTPQGVIFSCKPKVFNNINYKKVIILDNLRDPGNMGTLIRSASAFNIDAIILTGDCVDYKSPKVLRSTMGAIFKVPILTMSIDECKDTLKNLEIYATYLDENSKSIKDIDTKKCAIIIGNEANGVSSEWISICDEKIIIPMNENTESLNASVAGSVIMWEMMNK